MGDTKVVDRVTEIIRNATRLHYASRALAEELEAENLLANKRTQFATVEEANANGVRSGMLIGGDTFGDEDDISATDN